MRKFIFTLFIAILATTILADNPKYIFLFIGDGMSSPQLNLTESFLRKTKKEDLLINQFPYKASTRTSSANAVVTDSAAAGTAIACGEKTNNGRIGMAADGTTKLESVAYAAQKAGKKVGIITSVTINHATPAAFYAHRPSRGQYYEIALDLVNSNFDYFGGGGVDKPEDKKSDEFKGNIYELAKQARYTITSTPEEFAKLNKDSGKVYARGSNGALPYEITKQDGLKLADFVAKGIELLDNPNGFFIMCEGGMIDWACHDNDAVSALFEVIALNEAVKVAYDFAQKHPQETLIVITGDHETGGLKLEFDNAAYEANLDKLTLQTQTAGVFNSMARKLIADKKDFTFDDIKPAFTELFGLKFDGPADDFMTVTPAELKTLQDAFDAQYPKEKDKKANRNALKFAGLKVFNGKFGITWSTLGHSALPVITTAYGNSAQLFQGDYENTYISQTLKKLVVK
ncbi:MAG: alkaline phosphatase [Lentisphaerae bacterium]|jgi:alkaline phosphatase|nr:alkaline phosphatase [Lentisphaerota bacterium]